MSLFARLSSPRSSAPGSTPHLVICPFAGASYSAFRGWRVLGRIDISVSLMTYPGRDHRIEEPIITSVPELASQLADELRTRPPDGTWFLIGHSMGAQVAFETCRLLEESGPRPDGLVVSACHAPHMESRRLLSHCDDDEFIEQLIRIGGCPREMRTDAEFRACFLPMLRGDFQASEHYYRAVDESFAGLETPTLLLYGTLDDEARRDEVEEWTRWLSGRTMLEAVAGNHFFLTQRPDAFIASMSRAFGLSLQAAPAPAHAPLPPDHFP